MRTPDSVGGPFFVPEVEIPIFLAPGYPKHAQANLQRVTRAFHLMSAWGNLIRLKLAHANRDFAASVAGSKA